MVCVFLLVIIIAIAIYFYASNNNDDEEKEEESDQQSQNNNINEKENKCPVCQETQCPTCAVCPPKQECPAPIVCPPPTICPPKEDCPAPIVCPAPTICPAPIVCPSLTGKVSVVGIYTDTKQLLNFSQIAVYDKNNIIVPLNENNIRAATPGFNTVPTTAIDGKMSARNHPNIYHSANDNFPYYELLLPSVNVGSIVIYNRADCCADRLTNFKLVLKDATFKTLASVNLRNSAMQRYTYDGISNLTLVQ